MLSIDKFGLVFDTLGMKTLILISLLVGASASANLTQTFQRPLIDGASVSADYRAQSPGKKLSLRYTMEENIETLAKNGQLGTDTVKALSPDILQDRTILIGIDIFFWDSVKPSSDDSVAALKQLMALVSAQQIPIVLGDIPPLRPSQPSRNLLNQEIRQACAAYEKCKLLPLDAIFREVMAQGYLDYKGQRYTLPELLPDGLHVTDPASEYLADQIENLF